MNSVQDVWDAVYQKISDAYTPTAANTWFAGNRYTYRSPHELQML